MGTKIQSEWHRLNQTVINCRLCPRLVKYRQHVAEIKRRAYLNETYWGRPIIGCGDPRARLLIVGLAPAAHGANRTGRIFTGDGSANFLMEGLYRTGFANQPFSRARNDGLRFTDAYVTAIVRCAPPENTPLPQEIVNCRRYLLRELRLLTRMRVVLTLGQIATQGFLKAWETHHPEAPRIRVTFSHGGLYSLDSEHLLVMSYHPSRQNTQTGRLTMAMLLSALRKARASCLR